MGSYTTGSKRIRFEMNQYSWAPIREVAVIFIGIFLTMIPALEFLAQVADRLPLNTMTFFIFSGSLSAFLDNAPDLPHLIRDGGCAGRRPDRHGRRSQRRHHRCPGDLVARHQPGLGLAAVPSPHRQRTELHGQGSRRVTRGRHALPQGYIGWTVRYLVRPSWSPWPASSWASRSW